MTAGEAPVRVVGLDDAGAPVVAFVLAHGEDPQTGLRSRGVEPLEALRASGSVGTHGLTLEYRVGAGNGIPLKQRQPQHQRAPVDPDLVRRPEETATTHQRVAVYAVVRSSRGILLTENSGRTNSPGRWALPGGGMDRGEGPEQSLHREVWEETGQRVVLAGLATVTTQHWVGRAPDGRLEDFHAVRIIYRADCPEPTDPVVHEVEGTTADAAWVPVGQLPLVGLTRTWADIVLELTATGA